MEAIVLAGGLGTRLKTVISDIPKPMAPVMDKPFLAYLMDYLSNNGVKRVILSIGYKHEIIQGFFRNKYKNIDIEYSVEDEPLGTGGGIKRALTKIKGNYVFIINGDTYFNVDLKNLLKFHLREKSELTLSLKPLKCFERYGSVVIKGYRIIGFEEKKHKEQGFINGGVYVAKSDFLKKLILPDKFSFEKDILEKHVNDMMFGAYISREYFVDIGVPEDYHTAKRELAEHI